MNSENCYRDKDSRDTTFSNYHLGHNPSDIRMIIQNYSGCTRKFLSPRINVHHQNENNTAREAGKQIKTIYEIFKCPSTDS